MPEMGLTTDKDLADFCGVSAGLVSQWFKGTSQLGAKPLKAFSRTNFNLDWIVEGQLPKYRPGATNSGQRLDRSIPDPLPSQMIELLTAFQHCSVEHREQILSLALTSQVRQKKSKTRGV